MKKRIQGKFTVVLTEFVSILVVIFNLNPFQVLAQSTERWSPQERIPNYSQAVYTPRLVADQNWTVHAFASDSVGDINPQVAIVYRRWTVNEGWTVPNDIVLSPVKEARIHGALLDNAGTMHLAFFGGIDPNGEIYYSKAPAAEANNASAWTMPISVGSNAITPDDAELISNDTGHLYVIYSGDEDGSGVYETHSYDSGDTWSEPILVFNSYSDELMPWYLDAYVDTRNGINLVWAVQNRKSGNAVSVHYAKLGYGQNEWTIPITLADINGLPNGAPAIIEYHDELFVVYFAADNEQKSMTRVLRKSEDGGKSWTEPIQLFPHIGNNGPASLVIDSNDTLHMFFGNRVTTGDQIIWGLWHSVLRGGNWTIPQAIVSGPKTDYFDPVEARAVVSQGNVVLVTWMNDYGTISLGTGGTFYSYAVIDAPELPAQPLPTVSPSPTDTTVAIVAKMTPVPVATLKGIFADQRHFASSGEVNIARSLLAGIVPVVLLVLTILSIHQFAKHRH